MNFCKQYNKIMNKIDYYELKYIGKKTDAGIKQHFKRREVYEVNVIFGIIAVLFWSLVLLILIPIFVIVNFVINKILKLTTSKCK